MLQAFVARIGAPPKMLLFMAAIVDRDRALDAVRELLGGLHVEGPYAINRVTKRGLGKLKPGEIR